MRCSNYGRWLSLGWVLAAMAMGCQTPPSGNGRPVPVLSLTRSTATIESLRQPEKVEQSLALNGAVVQRLAILNGWLYQVDDGTGQVWVRSQQAAPTLGQQIYVKGLLRYEPIVISDVDLGDYYLEEKQREPQVSVP